MTRPLRSSVDRLVDATARRPAGWLGRRLYGGPGGAPGGHEAVFDRVLELAGPLAGERCLEIGCGGGRLLERVLAAGAAGAAGVDHSAEMLALSAARNRRALDEGRLELRRADAARLPFADAAFTVALSANMLFFVAEPERALAELRRVLAPGGRLVIATVPGPLPAPSPRTWWVAVWGRGMRVYDDATLRAMLERAGFAHVAVQSTGGAHPLQLARAA